MADHEREPRTMPTMAVAPGGGAGAARAGQPAAKRIEVAIKKAGSTDSDKVSKALIGLSVDTPVGKLTIREKDHQANRGQLYGKTVMDPKYPFPIMKPVEYVDPTKFMD